MSSHTGSLILLSKSSKHHPLWVNRLWPSPILTFEGIKRFFFFFFFKAGVRACSFQLLSKSHRPGQVSRTRV